MNGLYIAYGCTTFALALAARVYLNMQFRKIHDDIYNDMRKGDETLEKILDDRISKNIKNHESEEKTSMKEMYTKCNNMLKTLGDSKALKALSEKSIEYTTVMDEKIRDITSEKLEEMSTKLDEALQNVADLYNSKEEEFNETKQWINDRLSGHFGVEYNKSHDSLRSTADTVSDISM